MKSRAVSRALALGASIPLIALAAIGTWRSIERFYIAHLFAQGRTPTDDLMAAHINMPLELEVWGMVLGIFLVVSFLLRFGLRSRRSN